VKFGARSRINGWSAGFARWAQETWKLHEHDQESDYYLGVILGITAARSHSQSPPPKRDGRTDKGYYEGYRDARTLINKALKFGDAPPGTYAELLALQHQENAGPSAQEIWDDGREHLTAAMSMLLEDETAIREGTFVAAGKRLEELLSLLTSAMYSFEMLVEAEAHLEIVRPLAEGCRKLSEGLLNGDSKDVFEGRKLIVHTMLPIEEEAERRLHSSNQRGTPPKS
jgi:hypothetical protein